MSMVYPSIERWIIDRGVLATTLEGVRSSGANVRESGAFWLGKRDRTAVIPAVVLLRGVGVEERPDYWRVSAEVFGAVTRWASPRNLCLMAVVHTHLNGIPPRLSWTDRNYGLRVPGILSIVIGNGGEESNHLNWGWYVFERDDYRQLSQSEIGENLRIADSNLFEGWVANANGVRPLLET